MTERPACSVAEVARRTGLDHAQAALALAQLELLGIVERVDDLRFRATDDAWTTYPRPQGWKKAA